MPTITKRDTHSPEITVDTKPGYYYVSVVDTGRYALLAGPYDSHQEALDAVEKAKALAFDMDPRAAFYGYGTCRVERTLLPRMGILNNQMGLEPWTKSVS